jgi:hypothetical protein
VLRSLDDTMPVTVHDGRLDLLAYNAAAAELLGPLAGDGPYGRNIVHQCFTTAALREVLDDEGADRLAREATAELRTALSRYPEMTISDPCSGNSRRPAPPSGSTGREARSAGGDPRSNASVTRPGDG